MDKREIIERYYQCFREQDQDGLRSILTTHFHHVSSFAEYIDRDKMLEAIWPMVGQSWATNLQIFGEGSEFMVRYQIESRVRSPMSMAEYVRFEGNLITEIEVYVGRQLDA